MSIRHHSFSTFLEEITWVAKEIKEEIKNGRTPGEIAIISRKHAELKEIVKMLHHLQVPISYEYGDNVLESAHISQLTTILEYIASLYTPHQEPKDELLPEILSYPFWDVPSTTIFDVSLQAYQKSKSWIEIMLEYPDLKIQQIAKFLLILGQKAEHASAEEIIDEILGVTQDAIISDNEQDEDSSHNEEDTSSNSEYTSPYKHYYFDRNWETNRPAYLVFLSELRVFITSIRDFHEKELIKVGDVLEFVHLRKKFHLNLRNTQQYNNPEHAVNLLTAHKAKGLEFESVYLLNCIEKSWNGRKVVNKVGLPSNLSLFPDADTDDDSVRLFFVATTRAKTNLTVTWHTQDESGKDVQPYQYLPTDQIKNASSTQADQEILGGFEIWIKSSIQKRNLTSDEKEFLQPLISNYKLSVTHLNNFLDITRGGPHKFLEHNLLRFPQSKNVQSRYGTAVHAAIASFYNQLRATKNLPELEYLYEQFEKALRREKLNPGVFQEYLNTGKERLKKYVELQQSMFQPEDLVELNFSSQNVMIGDAPLTGAIDRMSPLADTRSFLVTDLKTGKGFDSWSAGSIDDKIKLDRYRRQLVFYKILVENSREFGGKYQVHEGSLEFVDVKPNETNVKTLRTDISLEESEILKALIQKIYHRITTYNFDLKREYPQNLDGINQFIQDLLEE